MRAGHTILLLVVCFGASCHSEPGKPELPRQPEIQQAVHAAGRAQLQPLLRRIPAGLLGGHGFADPAELTRAKAGPLYRMVALDPGRLAAGSPAPFVPQEVWRLAVLVAGEHRALATLTRVAGRLQAVEIGAAGLARELGALDEAGEGGAILRVHALRCDFFVGAPTGEQRTWRALPLRSAQRAMGLGGEALAHPALLRRLALRINDAGR